MGSLRDYAEHAKGNLDELHALTQDILIRVTRFFRDPEAFEVLSQTVFPVLIRKTPPDGTLRIWVPGCSTGEEAYSIAMCLLEMADHMRSRLSFKIFATDVNEAALEKARRGVYLENVSVDVSPGRVARFFSREGRMLRVGKKLRDLCIFSRHDLLSDPPFSRMDLVSCRNVLIYLDSMQDFALSRFHFALNSGGFLLLGKSESVVSSPGLFAPADKAARLYVRQESARYPEARRGVTQKKPASATPRAAVHREVSPARAIDLREQAGRILIARYGPPRAIVNANLETIGYGPDDAAYSSPPPSLGERAREMLETVGTVQLAGLKNAARAAEETGRSVRVERVKLAGGASPHEVDIEITPLGPHRHQFLLVFEESDGQSGRVPKHGATARKGGKGKLETRVNRLEKELASTRAHLESVVVEQEKANEEVVASNEELQSLNEELESSKEELEASNEEMTSLNQELQIRNTELANAREFAQATVDTVRTGLLVLGADLCILKVNRSFCQIYRVSPEEIEHRFVYEVADRLFDLPKLRTLLEQVLPSTHAVEDFEMEYSKAPGGPRVLVLNARRFESEPRILLAVQDVTDSKRSELAMRQSQKMEAIGYLAAGVAHDFNNLLTGVIGNASLLIEELPAGDRRRPMLKNIISGGESAAELTRQLLAYAGKGRFYMERVDLSEVVIRTGALVHPSIPPHVQLRLNLDKELPRLLADPGQIQQVVMNLMINAAEAIGDRSGMVQVHTGRQTVVEALEGVVGEKAAPGEYIFLEVVDNGSGIDQQTLHRIFDPFFTTKFTGRGLGLAAVLGIVRQHKGVVQIQSVPGRGSTFRVLFAADGQPPPEVEAATISGDLRGTGAVLVVDDEELIRSVVQSALAPYGYTVLAARDSSEGVRMFQESSGEIGLVLLDLAMPGTDGSETLDRIREIRPDVPVLVCSGFGDMEVEKRFEGKTVAGFFPKPYTANQLARKVHECFRAPAPQPAAPGSQVR